MAIVARSIARLAGHDGRWQGTYQSIWCNIDEWLFAATELMAVCDPQHDGPCECKIAILINGCLATMLAVYPQHDFAEHHTCGEIYQGSVYQIMQHIQTSFLL